MIEGSNSDASVASEKRYQNKKKNKKVNKRKKLHSDESDGNIENKKLMQIVEDQKKIIEDLTNEVSNLTNIIRELDNEETEEDENIAINDNADFPALPKKYNNETVTQKTLPATTKQNAKDVTSNNGHGEDTTRGKASNPTLNRKPPPITIYNMEAKELIDKVKKGITNNFSVTVVNKNVTKINAQQISDHLKIIESLKTDGIKFFSYTPKEYKHFTLIVKKLPLSFEAEDLENAIIEKNIKVQIIKVFKTKFNWLVQVSNDSDIKEMKNIKYLLHCKVQIENLKNTRLIQCKNCQRYSHTASNCNMPYRCVKCGKSHEPGRCTIPPKDQNNEVIVITNEITGERTNRIGIAVKCINCGEEGHTANAPVCQTRLNLLNKIKKTKKPANTQYLKRNNDVSYASLLQNSNNNAKAMQNSFNSFETINKDCSQLFGKDLLTCVATVGDFSKTYSSLTTKEEKTKALFSLFLSLKLND